MRSVCSGYIKKVKEKDFVYVWVVGFNTEDERGTETNRPTSIVDCWHSRTNVTFPQDPYIIGKFFDRAVLSPFLFSSFCIHNLKVVYFSDEAGNGNGGRKYGNIAEERKIFFEEGNMAFLFLSLFFFPFSSSLTILSFLCLSLFQFSQSFSVVF